MWRVVDTAKAVFNVDNYKEYLSLQCDSALRNIVRIYPYDVAEGIDTTGDGEPDEGSLRGSSAVVAERIRKEIQERYRMQAFKFWKPALPIWPMHRRLQPSCCKGNRPAPL